MGIDKLKAKRGSRRIPENTLFMFTILGGGVGTILGMYIFRHKTKKKKFTVGMPIILILESLSKEIPLFSNSLNNILNFNLPWS